MALILPNQRSAIYCTLLFNFFSVLPSSTFTIREIFDQELPKDLTSPAGNQSSLEFFTGLSGKTYSIQEKFPDWEVIQHVDYGRAIIMAHAVENFTFKCRVIHPIIQPVVFYEISLEDGSTLILANGRKLGANESEGTAANNHTTAVSWEEQYEFVVPVSTSRKRGQCSGMDIHSHTWREDAVSLIYAHAKAPELKVAPQENGTRELAVGEVYKLECPIELGVPHANVTWTLPSGEKRPCRKSDHRGELYVEPLHQSDEGNYTCVATNKYGSVSYTYTVQLLFPHPTDHLKIQWRRFKGAVDELHSLIRSLPSHVQGKLLKQIDPIHA